MGDGQYSKAAIGKESFARKAAASHPDVMVVSHFKTEAFIRKAGCTVHSEKANVQLSQETATPILELLLRNNEENKMAEVTL